MTEPGALDAAVKLASAGYLPVPLLAGRKHFDVAAAGLAPLHLESRRKAMKELLFSSLLVSLALKRAEILAPASMFAAPEANVGLVTGYDNLLVLDFDSVPAFERFAGANERIVGAAPQVRTPKGRHVYLRSPVPLLTTSLYRGFRRVGHVKSLGGYVVCPPSRLASGETYRWENGLSVFDLRPPEIDSLAALGLAQASPLKAAYDRALGRGGFADV